MSTFPVVRKTSAVNSRIVYGTKMQWPACTIILYLLFNTIVIVACHKYSIINNHYKFSFRTTIIGFVSYVHLSVPPVHVEQALAA